MTRKSSKELVKALITGDGFLAHVVYSPNECLNYVNIMHMQSVIPKRVKPSSRGTHTCGFYRPWKGV